MGLDQKTTCSSTSASYWSFYNKIQEELFSGNERVHEDTQKPMLKAMEK